MKRYILFILSLFCIFAACFAKESLSSGEIISASPATGQLRYELPLYTINNPDFKWDIGVLYTSDGFRPYDYSFPVGSGWQLIAGGSISREIIGAADDLDSLVNGTSAEVGLLTYARNPNYPLSPYVSRLDIGSDFYSFSFGPYAGTFIFDSIGNVCILSGDFVVIDATDVTLQTNFSNQGNWRQNYQLQPSCFKLTTLDGYNYYFGSTISTAPLEYGGPLVNYYAPPILKWNLQRIVAPNGNALVFHYHAPDTTLWQYDIQYKWREIGNPFPESEDFIVSDTLSMSLLSNQHFLDVAHKIDQLHNYSILDSITNPQTGLTVSFDYIWLDNYIFKGAPSPAHVCLSNAKPFLSSVLVRVGNQPLKSWTFNYSQINVDSTPHRYLTSVSNNCNDTYSFAYNFNGEIELDSEVRGIDIWGYDKNYPEFGSLISSTNPLGATNNYNYSWAYVDSIRIPKLHQGQWQTHTMNYQHMMCHAIRLSSINVTNGTTLLFSKGYNYGETEHGTLNGPLAPGIMWDNIHGSGVLSIEYGYYNESIAKFAFTPFQKLHASIFPITYSCVSESVLDSDGHTSRITTYKYQTDDFIYQGVSSNDYNNFIHIREAWPYYQSHLWYRMLKSQTEKDASGLIISQTQNDYSGPATNNNLIRYRKGYWNYVPSSKYFCSYKIEVHDQIYRSSSFVYDSKFRLTFQSQTQGSDIRFIRMVYPDNLSNNIPNGMVPVDSFYFSNMVLKNYQMIGEPIEQYGGYIENDIEYVTNGTLVLKNIVYPQNPQQTIVTIRTFALHPTTPISSYTPVHTGNCHVLYNENYDAVSVARCQKWNRLVWEKSESDALGTSYQWSSDFLCPISKTIGGRTWSYSYTPYVGITSETSPRGLIIGYQYDNCGRLEEKFIMNNEQKEILEHYVYH